MSMVHDEDSRGPEDSNFSKGKHIWLLSDLHYAQIHSTLNRLKRKNKQLSSWFVHYTVFDKVLCTNKKATVLLTDRTT